MRVSPAPVRLVCCRPRRPDFQACDLSLLAMLVTQVKNAEPGAQRRLIRRHRVEMVAVQVGDTEGQV
jgi:hypothetical protein